jgi:hypothetical protein
MRFPDKVPLNESMDAWKIADITQIYESPLGQIGEFKIWSVYGDYIYLIFDADFVIAGNGYAKHYIPKNEIWIDRMTAEDDLPFVIIHEISESCIMRDLDYSYEKAHNMANAIEFEARKINYTPRQHKDTTLQEAE